MKSPAPDRIECPRCGALIPLTETLHHQLTEQVRRDLRGELAEERAKAVQEATAKAREAVDGELRDARSALEEKGARLEEARAAELELRRRERALEDGKRELELSLERRLAEERKAIREGVTKQVLEEQKLREADRDKLISDLKAQLEAAHRKAEQGSQQLQGEVQELDLEAVLREAFPHDVVDRVARGVRGGDLLQRVFTRTGTPCGTVLWESKRTKYWSDEWVEKLKADQREAKADVAVLVTEALPKDVSRFGLRDAIWVSGRAYFLPVAALLRESMAQVAFARNAAELKDQKMETLFRYLSGPGFRQRMEAVVETFVQVRQDLEKEKRTTATRWARQEKQLEKAVLALAGMHGDLEGLLGSSLPAVPALEEGEEAPPPPGEPGPEGGA
jgi:hypothetical protein